MLQKLIEEPGGMQKEVMIILEGKFPPLYIHPSYANLRIGILLHLRIRTPEI